MSKCIFCVKFSVLAIFGLALHQNSKAGGNFAWTLSWQNLTVFWKKKIIFWCGVAVAAKMAKKGKKWPKITKQYYVFFAPDYD